MTMLNLVGLAAFYQTLITSALPRFGWYVSIAVTFFRLNLIGTLSGVVLVQLLNTLLLMIWIPASAFQGVDRALEEAALDVGASRLRVFTQITLPQVYPALAAALLLTLARRAVANRPHRAWWPASKSRAAAIS